MSRLTERLRRMLHADDRLDREMAAEWEEAPAGKPASLPPEEVNPDTPAEQPDWWISVPFRQGRGLRRLLVVLSVLLCVGIITVLVITAQYLPHFGQAGNPANNEVSRRYIENGMEETGAVNAIRPLITPDTSEINAVASRTPPYSRMFSMLPLPPLPWMPRSISQLITSGISASIATSPTMNRGVATACFLYWRTRAASFLIIGFVSFLVNKTAYR